MLHLHGFEHDQHGAGDDDLPLGDPHVEYVAGHRRPEMAFVLRRRAVIGARIVVEFEAPALAAHGEPVVGSRSQRAVNGRAIDVADQLASRSRLQVSRRCGLPVKVHP